MLVELNSNKRSSTAKDEQNKKLINIKSKKECSFRLYLVLISKKYIKFKSEYCEN